MSVITEIRIPADDFELGRILHFDGASAIELEAIVPNGDATVPLFWIHHPAGNGCVDRIERYPAVSSVSEVDVFDDRILYRLEWDASRDQLLNCISTNRGNILRATATADGWHFEIRFPNHEALSRCRTCSEDAHISVELLRVYNPTDSDGDAGYGLSDPQLEALTLAVQMGYYDIPRRCTTKELAGKLDISDQAVTERLRRAIDTFVRHTLVSPEPMTE